MAKQKIALTTVFVALTGVAMRQHAAADIPVPCTGDATACGVLNVVQYGTDPQSGAHFVMRFDTPPDRLPQSMMSTLSIASSSDSCAAAVETYANINPGEGRSIDGYLCKLRVTWERR
jgi:hypothetical protein